MPTGTVDLFTIILYLFVKFLPIEVAAFLTKLKSELPSDLGGVPTAIKITEPCFNVLSKSSEKLILLFNRFSWINS